MEIKIESKSKSKIKSESKSKNGFGGWGDEMPVEKLCGFRVSCHNKFQPLGVDSESGIDEDEGTMTAKLQGFSDF